MDSTDSSLEMFLFWVVFSSLLLILSFCCKEFLTVDDPYYQLSEPRKVKIQRNLYQTETTALQWLEL